MDTMLFHNSSLLFFLFQDTPTTEIYTLSLHDALPISATQDHGGGAPGRGRMRVARRPARSLGSGGSWRVLRSSPATARRRGPSRRTPDAPASLVARRTGARAAPDARVRAAHAQRVARPG